MYILPDMVWYWDDMYVFPSVVDSSNLGEGESEREEQREWEGEEGGERTKKCIGNLEKF